MWVINFAFTVGALGYMRTSPDYVRWPAKDAVSSQWWTLGDNWESTVLFFCTFFQLTFASVVFSFSASFSRPVARNWILVGAWAVLFTIGAFLLLSNENYFTFVFHIASQAYNDVPPTSPTWAAFQKAGGAPSPGMSLRFRGGLFGILVANLATVAAWQKLVEPTGPLARAAHRLRPTRRPAVRL
jgi:cation-transporting ATPase 13A3/4/5